MWPDHYCHAICHDSVVWQTKAQGTNLAWWPENHYPIICFSSIVWPDQHNHGMCHNSIILQTIEETNSGWFDHIITIMFLQQYFATNIGARDHSEKYGMPSIQASDKLILELPHHHVVCHDGIVKQTQEYGLS